MIYKYRLKQQQQLYYLLIMQTVALNITACLDRINRHRSTVSPNWKIFVHFTACTKPNRFSFLACVFIGPTLRTLCLWVVIVSPCLCFIYAWAGCPFIYTNKLCCNVSLGICSHFASSSLLSFCSNCLLSP